MRGCLNAVLNSVRFFLALYPANPRCKTLHRTPNFAPSFISGLPDFKYAPGTLMLVPMGAWDQEKTNIRRRLFGWYVGATHRSLCTSEGWEINTNAATAAPSSDCGWQPLVLLHQHGRLPC